MSEETPPLVPVDEAARRFGSDRQLLVSTVTGRSAEELAAAYLVRGEPLGDFCDSLHDLVSHVLMWDEINLAVLTEAANGRRHWSLDPRWETAQAGRLLNRSGVLARREVPADLLLHRFGAVRDAVLDEFSRYDQEQWAAPMTPLHVRAGSVGALAQYVMTVPGVRAYSHAAYHLGRLAAEAPRTDM